MKARLSVKRMFWGAAGALAVCLAGCVSGSGVVVSGLASLMLGEFIIKSNKIGLQTLRVLIGSVIYRSLMYLARNYGIDCVGVIATGHTFVAQTYYSAREYLARVKDFFLCLVF